MAKQPFFYMNDGKLEAADSCEFDFKADFLGFTKKDEIYYPVHIKENTSCKAIVPNNHIELEKIIHKPENKSGHTEKVIIHDKSGRKFVLFKSVKLPQEQLDRIETRLKEEVISAKETKASNESESSDVTSNTLPITGAQDAQATLDTIILAKLPSTLLRIKELLNLNAHVKDVSDIKKQVICIHWQHLELLKDSVEAYQRLNSSDQNIIKSLRNENDYIVRQTTEVATSMLELKKEMKTLKSDLNDSELKNEMLIKDIQKVRNDLKMVVRDNDQYLTQIASNKNIVLKLSDTIEKSKIEYAELRNEYLRCKYKSGRFKLAVDVASQTNVISQADGIAQTDFIEEDPWMRYAEPQMGPSIRCSNILDNNKLHFLNSKSNVITLPRLNTPLITIGSVYGPIPPKIVDKQVKMEDLLLVDSPSRIIIKKSDEPVKTESHIPINTSDRLFALPKNYGPCTNSFSNINRNIIGSDANLGVQLYVPRLPNTSETYMTDLDVQNDWKFKLFQCFLGCDVEDINGNLPIHNAVLTNDILGVKKQCVVLSAKKVSVDVENHQGFTALQLSVLNKIDPEIITILIEKGADCSKIDEEGNNIFHLAVIHSNSKVLNLLIDANISNLLQAINAYNYEGVTPLIICGIRNQAEEAELLIKLGALLDLRDRKSGRTALFHAVSSNSVDSVKVLIESGADKKVRSFLGTSAIDVAFELDSVHSTIKFLVNSIPERERSIKSVINSEKKASPRPRSVKSKKRSVKQLNIVSKKVKVSDLK